MKRVAYLVDPVEVEYRTTTLAWVETHPYSPSRSQQAGFEIKTGGVFLFPLVAVFHPNAGRSCETRGRFHAQKQRCARHSAQTLEFAACETVFLDELAEGAALLAGEIGREADGALRLAEQRGEVGLFELRDGAGLCRLKIVEQGRHCAAVVFASLLHEIELIGVEAYQRFVGDEELAMNEVLELAHVARPAVVQKGRDGIGMQRARHLPVFLRVSRDEGLGEQQHVVAPLAQRRQHEAHENQAEQKNYAKEALIGHRAEVAIARGNDAHIGAATAPTHGPILAVLEKTQ